MVTPTQAEINLLIVPQVSAEQRLSIEKTTGFPITNEQLKFMITSGYVFRTTDNVSFQIQLG